MAAQTLNYIVTADTKQANTSLKKFQKRGAIAGTSVAAAFRTAGPAIAAMGVALAGAAVIKGFKFVVDKSAEFEKNMANVFTLIDSGTAGLDRLNKQLLELPPTLGSAAENAKALYQTISAGIPEESAVKFVAAAAKTAKAGLTDTETAVDALTSVLNAYGKSAKEVTTISDQMFVAIKAGKTTFEEMATSIGKVAPVAASLKVSTEDLFAAIATLTKSGVRTKEAITALKAGFSNILKPSSDAAKIAEDLNINFSAAALKAKGFATFMQDLQTATGGSTEKMAKLFGSVEALNAMLILVSEKGGPDFIKISKDMANATGETEKAFKKQTETYAAAKDELSVVFEKIAIAIGQKLLPVLTPLVKGFAEFLEKTFILKEGRFGSLFDSLGKAMGIVGDILSVTLVPALKLLVGVLKIMDIPFRIVIEVVNLLLTGIKSLTGIVADTYKNFEQWLSSLAKGEGIIGSVVRFIQSLIDKLKGARDLAKEILTFGLADTGDKMLEGKTDKQKEAIDKMKKAHQEFEIERNRILYGKEDIGTLGKIFSFHEPSKSAQKAARKSAEAFIKEFEKTMKEANIDVSQDIQEFKIRFLGEGSSVMPLTEKIKELTGEFDTFYKNIVEEAPTTKIKMEGASGEAISTALDVAENKFGNFFESVLEGTVSISEGFKGMVTQILASLAKMLRDKAIANLISMLATSIGGAFGGGTPYIPALQHGGTATAGRAHIVGERGPELFIPGKTGQVMPMGSSGGGGITINNNINVEGGGGAGGASTQADQRSLAETIARMVSEQTKMTLIEQSRSGGILNRPSFQTR